MLYEDMVPAIMLEAVGCPEMTILRVLRDETRQLYTDHYIWQVVDRAAALDVNGVLQISLPSESEIVMLRSVRGEDGPLDVVVLDEFAYDIFDDGGTTRAIVNLDGSWTSLPTPAGVTSVTAVVQVRPTFAATGVVDSIAQRDLKLIQHTTLARLLGMPAQKWSNPQYASFHAAEATRLVFQAKRRADGWTAVRTPIVSYGGI